MSAPKPVVVDTNILFSALLSDSSRFASTLFNPDYELFVTELVIVELFRHKERILTASRLTGDEVVQLFHALLRRLNLCKDSMVPPEHEVMATTLCSGVDPADAPHVALALTLGAPLWTGDRRLRKALEARGFTRFFDP